jgi:glycerol kinase
MKNYIIAIDQSTSATKAMLFDEQCRILGRNDIAHEQYYPQKGFVEHDAEEIYRNTVEAIRQLTGCIPHDDCCLSLAITNQRETVVVWDKRTGKPVGRAVVWQDSRGAELCRYLTEHGHTRMVQEKSGLIIDPNFSASGVRWILDHVEGAREAAHEGHLLMGTIDTWLIWKLTKGKVFATDTTNASRSMLFNIHTMEWDDDLLQLFGIPRTMMASVLPSDAVYGETTVEGIFEQPIQIAGVIGDSQGALAGQMCFGEGSGKITYGTGSSVMVNIGESPKAAPEGLVTSVAFSVLGKHFYGYEGNIYSTGATLKWLCDQIKLIGHPREIEAEIASLTDNGEVYIVPALAGLGAPWWKPNAKAGIVGMTFSTSRAHLLRAALESIAYQVKDLFDVMMQATGNHLRDICVDGGPTKNKFLMQFQADLLNSRIVCTEVEDASALGAVLMNGFARKIWTSFGEVTELRKGVQAFDPSPTEETDKAYKGWLRAVNTVIRY